MSPTAVRRVAPAAAVTILGSAAHVMATAGPAGAHTVEGGDLPAPSWLLAYGGAFGILLVALALRSAWPRPRRVLASDLAEATAEPVHTAIEPPSIHAGHVAGTVLLAGAIFAAIVGPDSPAANVAPLAVLVAWWIGLPILCVLAGDVMAAINPFQLPTSALERLIGRRGRVPSEPPAWTSAAFLGAFAWFFLAYHAPGSPRALAVFLLLYVAAAVAGGIAWGRGWTVRGEGFAGLSAAVAEVSWRRSDRRAVPGLAPLMVVWVGTTAFDAVTSTPFWADVRGASSGWGATAFNTVGLVWLVAIAAGVYLAAIRVSERSPGDRGVGLARPLGLALVPLATAWFVAHDLTLLLAEGQNLIVLVSDPIGRGWDLFGTIDRDVDFGIVEEPWVRWVQLVLLAVGHVLTVLIAHDVALRLRGRRAGLQVTYALAVVSAVSVVAAVLLVLG